MSNASAASALVIRPYSRSDAPALWDVFFSAIHELASADYAPEQIAAWAPQKIDPALWAKRMDGIQPFVAERGGRPVGYSDLQPNGYIDHFFVSPSVARQGVGSALMRRIHQHADELSIDRLYSDVSITARPFYEAFGFAVEAAQMASISGIELANYRMAKRLAPDPSR